MSTDEITRLRRIEEMVRVLMTLTKPTMTFAEVMEATGYRTRSTTYRFLKQHGIRGIRRRYDRARVITALTQP
jgi:hypothetical protein